MLKISSKKVVEEIQKEINKRSVFVNTNTTKIDNFTTEKIQKSSKFYNFAKKVGKYLHRKGLYKLVSFVQNNFKIYPNYYTYTLEDFIKFHDEEFIDNAYKLILNRKADNEGKNHYLSHLRDGSFSKTNIILNIYFSKEGRKQNVLILGLKKRFILYSSYKIPLFGYLLKILFTIITLPRLLKKINQYENNVMSVLKQHDMIQEELTKTKADNQIVADLEELTKTKADNQTVVDLEELTKTKADNQTVADLEELTKTKADNQTVADLEELTKTKANLEDYEKYLQAVYYAQEHIKITQKNMQILIDEAKKRLPNKVLNKEELLIIADEEKYKYDSLYVEFENNFRGTRKDIKGRLKIYLPYIEKLPFKQEKIMFLDVGCGRGEWLELLIDNKYSNIKGLDINRIMVSESKNLGFDAIQSDVIKYLTSLKDESLSVITGFHLIEHLPFEIMMELFEESLRVLKKGGMIIFETPNPENILVGACSFYTDPTHINPLVPVTTEFLVKQTGFKDVQIKRLHKYSEYDIVQSTDTFIQTHFSNEMDYSIIGYK